MRKLIALGALGLALAGCGDGPAAPTPVPALPPTPPAAATATVIPPTAPTATLLSAEPEGVTAGPPGPTMAPPLVPAFPTATVAFSGAGSVAGTLPFLLRGGTYHVTWYTQPKGTAKPSEPWSLNATIHPADGGNVRSLLNLTVPSAGLQNGSVLVENIPAGTYLLDVTAPDSCSWTVSISP